MLNGSRPEGSIAEGYIAEECVTFCSRFLGVHGTTDDKISSTVFNRGPEPAKYHISWRMNKDGTLFHVEDAEWKACHSYVLFNSANEEVERFLK